LVKLCATTTASGVSLIRMPTVSQAAGSSAFSPRGYHGPPGKAAESIQRI
jgi:hypothetical protein